MNKKIAANCYNIGNVFMRFISIFISAIFFISSLSVLGQKAQITARDFHEYIQFLASDSLKGRKPGTPEINVAANYIRDHFKEAGLSMMGEAGFQWFEIVTDVSLGLNNRFLVEGFDGRLKKDFIPLSFSSNSSVNASVVFAGYGFDVSLDSLKWNDYQTIDVKNKWVMIFRADPDLDNADSKFIPYGDIRSKVLTAKDKGAAGLLLVTPKALEKEDKLMPLAIENNEITAGIPILNITRETANNILKRSGLNTDTLERFIMNKKVPMSFETGTVVRATADVVQKRAKTANVIAFIEGNDIMLKNEYLVVGGHYDHLGFGGPGSGSRMPDTNAIHHGADDNASGTAMVMELAKILALEKGKIKRSLIFVTFSAEEIGLLGSKYFIDHPPVDLKKIKAMFNFDMVGRFDKEKNAISLGGTGTSLETDSLLRLLEANLSFKVVHSSDGYGPSDHAAFYSSNIPVFYFNTGAHTDYHTPFDDTDKIDFDAEKKIGDFAAACILMVDTLPKTLTFKESGKKENSNRSGRKLKVTLGIMPDFAGLEKKGLGVDGVTKDGPADKGGLKKGDIITRINGMTVGNIYEYMSRLQKLKHGMIVNVEVLREEEPTVLIISL
ncbi:MAG: M20/M25/M40 family metallo-hydrolase [Bacteroidales bacterium]|nr:M20/M25/M40 family metallo-hydrolase [Bacteroidales bacterium]